jgi:hypothetical protein
VPTGLIDEQESVGARRDVLGDFSKMQVHREAVAGGQDEARALAFLGANGAEDVGRTGSLILRSAGPRATLGPSACDLVLLADPGFILEPDFYLVGLDAFFARDFLQAAWECFLKSSIAPSACA